jgi:ATP-binding cassette, subfamily B, bacterial MsbA
MQQASTSQDSSLKIYFRLLRYLRPFLGLFAISLLGYVIFASAQPMMAVILKYFVDGLTAPVGVSPSMRSHCLAASN